MDGIKEVALEFDRTDRKFNFGEKITGTLIFTPAEDIAPSIYELHYQWRTHGQTEPSHGEIISKKITKAIPFQKGRSYRIPFVLNIDSGPETFHGHGEKLDWYVWASCVSGGKRDDNIREETETDFFLKDDTETEITLSSGSGLVVLENEVTSNVLVDGIFWFIIALIGGLVLIIVWFNWPSEILFFLTIAFFVGAGFIIYKLSIRGIPEYRLGKVKLVFRGKGKVEATVSFRPRRNVLLSTVRLKVNVIEAITIGQGSTERTTKKTLFSKNNDLRVNEIVEPGNEWIGTVSVPIKPNLPKTADYPITWDKRKSIKWYAEVEIGQSGWSIWTKECEIQVW